MPHLRVQLNAGTQLEPVEPERGSLVHRNHGWRRKIVGRRRYVARMSTNSAYTASDSDRELTLDELDARIVANAGKLAAATCRWLLLIAEFDRRDGCLRAALPSTAHWLAFRCSLAHRTAVEHVRVARCLAAHPALAEQMGTGRLSYSHVRAISRVAGPKEHQLVDDLIEAARHGTVAQLEVLVRGLRTVDDNERGAPAHEEYVRHSWSDDSHWRLSAKLDPERGALFEGALQAVAKAEEISEPEALVRLAEIGLAVLADANRIAPRLRGDERAAVVIQLDATQLPAQRDAADDPAAAVGREPRSAERGRPYARIAGGPGLPDRVVKRLLCAGRVRTVVRDGTNILDVGRSHRLVTERQFRALLIRQHGSCGFPGCPNRRHLQAHHRKHWLHGGATDLDNLILLCEPHHLGHHNGEFVIDTDPAGGCLFRLPDGTALSRPAPVPSGAARRGVDDAGWVDREHASVSATAVTSLWDGQRLERAYAIAVLAQRRLTA